MSYKTRDGVDITGYVTMPPGVSAQSLPMVVMPHGGPESRDDTSFDWFPQFFAVRGYVVFPAQFSRLHRIWRGTSQGRLPPMGRPHAGRCGPMALRR